MNRLRSTVEVRLPPIFTFVLPPPPPSTPGGHGEHFGPGPDAIGRQEAVWEGRTHVAAVAAATAAAAAAAPAAAGHAPSQPSVHRGYGGSVPQPAEWRAARCQARTCRHASRGPPGGARLPPLGQPRLPVRLPPGKGGSAPLAWRQAWAAVHGAAEGSSSSGGGSKSDNAAAAAAAAAARATAAAAARATAAAGPWF